jgi:hypothetical protein
MFSLPFASLPPISKGHGGEASYQTDQTDYLCSGWNHHHETQTEQSEASKRHGDADTDPVVLTTRLS